MAEILDKYILKRFLKTLFLTICAFYIIVLIVDFVEKVDTFIDRNAAYTDVVLYFYYALPNFFIMIMPISLLMASLFTMGQFVKFGELTALKAAGVSLYRIVAPVILLGFVISLFSYWFGENIVTSYEREKSNIYNVNIKKNKAVLMRKENVIMQDTNDRVISIAHYDGPRHKGRVVNIQKRNGNRILLTLSAQEMIPAEGEWLLLDGVIRDFSTGEEIVQEFEEYRITDFTFTEEDIVSVSIEPEEMNAIELTQYIEKLKQIGSPYDHWYVDYYKKFAFPFANLIVVLLGLPLATQRWRGGATVGFGICILICFFYYSIMTFTHALGYKGTLSPVMAAWISNIVFGSMGVFVLIKAQK